MSDCSAIYVKINVEIDKHRDGQTIYGYSGMIANAYRGYDPIGMISRSSSGLEYLLTHLFEFSNTDDNTLETFRRMFDVDLSEKKMDISNNLLLECEDNAFDYPLKIKDLRDDRDTYSTLYITVDKKSDSAPIVKYAFYGNKIIPKRTDDFIPGERVISVENNIIDSDIEWHIWTIREYADQFKCMCDQVPWLDACISKFEQSAELMTSEELNEFRETSCSEYNNHIVEKVLKEKPVVPYHFEIKIPDGSTVFDVEIEEFDLPVRAYHILMKNGINTIGDLMGQSSSEILQLKKNLGEKSFEEIKDKLALVGLTLKM